MVNAYTLSAGVVALFASFFVLVYIDWDHPPIDVDQVGFRGTAMETPRNPRREAARRDATVVPPPPWDDPDTSGPRAGELYENVQILTDLSDDQFNRFMAAITAWVAPEEQSCNYCHNPDNLADDSVYTKVVTRRMIEMTRHINQTWTDHVKDTGVTCYTCHRGNAVPAEVWARDTGIPQAGGYAAGRNGQNIAGVTVGLASLPTDPFSLFLKGDSGIRVQSGTALPSDNPADWEQAEWTYGLMMHMSSGLGVACTYCHNTRAMGRWEQSPAARVTAWHGIRMTRDVNNSFIDSLDAVFPANGEGPFGNRRGPHGDLLKANCATCHNGVNKPLYGAPMAADYPSLR